MLPESRRRRLLDLLTAAGHGNVDELATRLNVSPSTIRRDLDALERTGRLLRTHGGAVLPHASTAFEPLHSEKQGARLDLKTAIAREAARRVSDGDVIVLDAGSTTLALAAELYQRRGLTVITSDLKVALELTTSSNAHEVIVTGGRVRSQLYSLIGPIAEANLRHLHADHAFLGADAIDLERGVTNANLDEAAVKRLAISACRRATLLADHTKFDRVSLAHVVPIDAFDEVITDRAIDPTCFERYTQAGVHMTRAGEEE